MAILVIGVALGIGGTVFFVAIMIMLAKGLNGQWSQFERRRLARAGYWLVGIGAVLKHLER